MQKCSKCLLEKPLTDFYRNKTSKSGYAKVCKTCWQIRSKEWVKNHPERSNQIKRDWAKNNPDKVTTTNRKWELANPDKVAAKSSRYKKRHRAKATEQENIRRARKKANGIFLISEKEMQKLYASPCIYCESKESITMDHVIPIRLGGRHSIGNIVPACKSCNSRKQSSTVMEWRIRNLKHSGREYQSPHHLTQETNTATNQHQK